MIMEEENILDDETINKIINMADEGTLNKIQDKIWEKQFKIYSIKDEQEKIEYIKNNTNGLNGINLEDVKQIETDFDNYVYVVLNNGKFYENGILQDSNINRLYAFDGLNIFKITNSNQIIPVQFDMENWRELDWYLYNEGEPYKKITTDISHFVALTQEGRVIAIHSLPIGLGIVPENFIDVEDILFVPNENNQDLVMPYIIKNNEKMPLYIGG